MERLANNITNWMVKMGAPEENREIISYGLIAVLYELILNPIVLTVAAVFDMFFEMILWTLVYIPLRRNMGGRHETNSSKCFYVSLLISLCSIFLIKPFSQYNWILIIEALFSLIVVFVCAPVLHVNHPYPQKRRERAKRKSLIFMIIAILLLITLSILRQDTLSHAIGISIFTVSALCLLGFLSNAKG